MIKFQALKKVKSLKKAKEDPYFELVGKSFQRE